MDNLRLILLIIGCLIVMGIYLWEIFNNKPKKRTDILNAVDEVPDHEISPLNRNDISTDNYSADALADLGSLLAPARDQQNANAPDNPEPFHVTTSKNDPDDKTGDSEEEVDLPLEMSVRDYEAGMNENRKQEIFTTQDEETHSEAPPDETESSLEEVEEAEIPESNKSSDDLLVLYITSPSHISFNGLSISKAADEVGMVYGHMNIFHHFGPGKLHSGQPLFSLANMHEPGSFDLGRMADLKTKGLAIFMYSPASIDASVVFELFLNTAQRLAKLLGGTVRTADNAELTNITINTLREKAVSLSVNQ